MVYPSTSIPSLPGTTPPEPTPIQQAQHPALSPAIDTLATAPASFPQVLIHRPTDKPSLISPHLPTEPTKRPSLSELRFLAAIDAFRSFGDQIITLLGTRLEAFRLELQDITAENLQRLKESAANAQASDFWSLLKRIATALLSALSAVIGVSLIASGGGALVGGAMIASGIFSIANMLMTESAAWDWVAKKLANEDEDRRKMLSTLLPTAVGVLAGVIGLCGSAGAFAWSGIDFTNKAVLIAQSSLAIFSGATTIGKGYADAKLIWSQADLTAVKAKITIHQQFIDTTMKSVEGMLDGINSAHAKSRQLIQMAIRSREVIEI